MEIKKASDNNINNNSQLSINTINEKFYKDELEIEAFLQNDNCINDLLTKEKSRFQILLTRNNIKKLINYSLNPNYINNNNNLQTNLRITYYSTEILCSPCGLLFEKSIQIINSNENKKKNDNDSNKINLANNDKTLSSEKFAQVGVVEEKHNTGDSPKEESSKVAYESYEYEFKNEEENEYQKDLEERYVDLLKDNMIPTEHQIEKHKRKTFSDYNEDEKNMINEFLNEIFKNLDDKNYYENQTYMGYFQKIVNYLLFNESDVTINYLFNNPSIFKNFYEQLNCSSIQNILENILNIIFDRQEDKYNKEYLKIINDLIDLLDELIKFDRFEKIEYICQIIINTLINNTEKQLIECFFENEDIMKKIVILIEKLIKINNNDKILINLINLLCQLNLVILNSLDEWNSYDFNQEDKNVFINENIIKNTFECQYNPEKKIDKNHIFEKFQQNSEKYISYLIKIYILIKDDIKKKYIDYKDIIDEQNNLNNKKFGLKHLNEWKYILSFFKIYIFTIYISKISKNDKINYLYNKNDFYDQDLFNISISLFFQYTLVNLYQNIFVNLIKLICIEKCPDYLTREFLYNQENVLHNKDLITLIMNNIEKNGKDKKRNLLIASEFEILKIIFSSYNSEILKFMKNSDLYKIYKKNYLDSIKPKFENQLNNDYSFSFSEILASDISKTFDGNESGMKLSFFRSIQSEIKHFINKCKEDKLKEIKTIETESFTEKKDGTKIRKIIKQKTMLNNINEITEIIEHEYDDQFSLQGKVTYSIK